MTLRRHPLAVAALAAVVLVGACGGDDGAATTAPAPTATTPPATTEAATTTTAAPVPPELAYAGPGPYPVGYLDLALPDGRGVAVWYPARPGSDAGVDPATYDLRVLFPPAELPKLEGVTAGSFTMDAAVGLPVADGGPFPLVTFSHGLAGWRWQSSFLTTHLASWGVVVAAPQHRSRDLTAVLTGALNQGQDDVTDLRQTVALVRDLTDGPLAGAVDATRVVAVGHSAGGNASFRFAADPEVVAYVPLAAGVGRAVGGQPASPPPEKPVTMVAGAQDAIAAVDAVRQAYDALPAPKRLAVLDGVTHLNGFMDVCTQGTEEGGLLQIALDRGVAVPELLVRLFADGCADTYAPAEQAWRPVRHMVTAAVRAAFGIDPAPVGLGPALASAYAPVTITWSEAP